MKKTGKKVLSDVIGPPPDPKKSHQIDFFTHRSEQPLRQLTTACKEDMSFKFNEE